MRHKKLYCKSPCGPCPFRVKCKLNPLGEKKAVEITQTDSFPCHRTEEPNLLQCAGHIHVMGNHNVFNRLSMAFDGKYIPIKNTEVLFKTKEDFIEHHKN